MDKVKEGTSWHHRLGATVPNLTEPRNVILTAVHSLWGQRGADLAHWHTGLLCLCTPCREAPREWRYSYTHSSPWL